MKVRVKIRILVLVSMVLFITILGYSQDRIMFLNEKGKIKTIKTRISKIEDHYIYYNSGKKKLLKDQVLAYSISKTEVKYSEGYTSTSLFHTINDSLYVNTKYSKINYSHNYSKFYDKLIENYDEFQFNEGFIVDSNLDTVNCEICLNKRKNKKNSYFIVVAKIENKMQLFTANDISGYSIDGDKYISYKTVNDDGVFSFFIKEIVRGKMNLYERDEVPGDRRFIYLMQSGLGGSFYVISPFENNLSLDTRKHNDNRKSTTLMIKSNNIHQKFKLFMSTQFADCLMVKNMILSEIYTIHDMPSIIRAYNNCF